jgi:hypothetical protein
MLSQILHGSGQFLYSCSRFSAWQLAHLGALFLLAVFILEFFNVLYYILYFCK